MLENVNAVELLTVAIGLLTVAGVLLHSHWLYRLNSKLDVLTGRVDGLSASNNARVTTLLTARVANDNPI